MAETPPPITAPPGAGLPAVELFVARLFSGLRRRWASRRSFDAKFDRERALIRQLIAGCDAELGARRVLIHRLPGLEDSSRDWSVWMTLDHLRIVHSEMRRVIAALAEGSMPAGTASTAAVKPIPDIGPGVVPLYETASDELRALATSVPDLRTRVRFAHPWFGPLDAAGWWSLAGGHLAIHRVQIERILETLRRDQR